MAFTTKEVISRQDLRRFVRFPNELYADNEYYVPQIESMEMDTLTPGKTGPLRSAKGNIGWHTMKTARLSAESPAS